MQSSLPRQIITSVLIIATAWGGWHYRGEVVRAAHIVKEFVVPTKPCEEPIPYSLGTFNTQFGMSKEQFLNAIVKAERIWETAAGKQLFVYSEDADLKINLVYDYRQKVTDKLAQVDTTLRTNRSTYDATKATYASLLASYNSQKTSIDTMIRTYESDKSAYEQQISYWNSHGGAPRSEFTKLEQDRQALNARIDAINTAKSSFNTLVDRINQTATTLNRLAKQLNITVDTYNTIGSSVGEEFSEGEYVLNSEGESITIYQYENTDKLIRVLAHELGHALGMDHVNDTKAIMYRLNQGTALQASMGDIEALQTLCSGS